MNLNLLQIELDLPLRRNEIRYLRGAIAERAGRERDLFHNHRDGQANKYHYRYPLIQYQCRYGRPLLLGLNAGAAQLRALLQTTDMRFCGDLPVASWRESCHPFGMTEQPRRFAIRQWLALNDENYRRWDALRGDAAAQRQELERVLAAHLLAFAAGIGFEVPRPRGLQVELEHVCAPEKARCHDAMLLSFDVIFRANMTLPAGVGIGKSASHGFGTLLPAPRGEGPGSGRKRRRTSGEIVYESVVI